MIKKYGRPTEKVAKIVATLGENYKEELIKLVDIESSMIYKTYETKNKEMNKYLLLCIDAYKRDTKKLIIEETNDKITATAIFVEENKDIFESLKESVRLYESGELDYITTNK